MRQVFLLLLTVCVAALCAHAQELVLVKDGKANAPIVICKDAPPYTRQAADELALYIEKVSGVRPDVIEGQPDPLPEHAIWVGHQPVLDKLFSNLDFDFKHPEEILIAANANHLVIAGRDRWDPEHPDIQIRRTIKNAQKEYGTVNAVYTFLQDYLEVRWLWPGELGEDIKPQQTLSFKPFEHHYHPQFQSRAGVFMIYMLNRLHPGHEWTRFQRIQLDSMNINGGHQFQDWWERFHKTNPEYFALQPDGSRGGGKQVYPYARAVKVCLSNPDVWKQWLSDVEDELERNPNATVFGAVANDGGYEGYCVCKNCLAWDNLDAPKTTVFWRGLAQQYVAMSDRQITFANTLAGLLKERYPDRNYYVMAMAYGASTWPPVGVKPAKNVIVSCVHSFHRSHGRHRMLNVDMRQLFLDYTKVAGEMVWRPNIGQGLGWHIGTPIVAPRKAIEDLKLVGEQNVVGLWFDAFYGHWANQGLHYYLVAQMAWNPDADGPAILKDYMARAYGPAAQTMTDYWELLESATLKITMDEAAAKDAWDQAFHKQADAYLDQATAQLKDALPKYAKRVDFARAGLKYLQLLQENMVLVEQWNQSSNLDTKARDTALANWEKIMALSEAHPYLVNQNYVNKKRGRMVEQFLPE